MLVAATLPAADSGGITGRVVDELCASAGGAIVRVLPEKGRPVASAEAGADGRFVLEHIKPGAYALRISSGGFYDRKVYGVVVSAGRATDVGSVALRATDCDAPGSGCQYQCDPSDEAATCNGPVVKKGRLVIRRGCSADFETGNSGCDNSSRDDVILRPGEGNSLYLHPVNGAQIATADSGAAGFTEKPMRIDGLVTGADFWVRTAAGHLYSHVIVIADFEAGAAGLDVSYANRRRVPRLTPASGSCRIAVVFR